MSKIIVFDIGGTWIRSGLYLPHANAVSEAEKIHIDWEIEHDAKASRLVDAIVKNAIGLGFPYKTKRIFISIGACLNHITGELYRSAPIFGNRQINFDLKKSLAIQLPGAEIAIINDVSALCYGYDALGYCAGHSQIAALTISSGIALRRYDVKNKKIFHDGEFGIQGEIGHLPIFNPYFQDQSLPLCDCGKSAHFAAFSSGKGMLNILSKNEQFEKNIGLVEYAKVLESNPNSFTKTLDAMSYPIAYAISMIFCLCPEIDKLFISGGVIECLGHYLNERIFFHLEEISYIYDVKFFKDRVVLIDKDIILGLVGSGYFSIVNPIQ